MRGTLKLLSWSKRLALRFQGRLTVSVGSFLTLPWDDIHIFI
jgi:hypothetical protein